MSTNIEVKSSSEKYPETQKKLDIALSKIEASKFKDEFELINLKLSLLEMPIDDMNEDQQKLFNTTLLNIARELSNPNYNSDIFQNFSDDLCKLKDVIDGKKQVLNDSVNEEKEFKIDSVISAIKSNFWEDSLEYFEAIDILEKIKLLPVNVINQTDKQRTLTIFKNLTLEKDSSKFLINVNNLKEIYKDVDFSDYFVENTKDDKDSSGWIESYMPNIDLTEEDIKDLFPDKTNITEWLVWIYILVNGWASWLRNIRDIVNVNLWDQIEKWETRALNEVEAEIRTTTDSKRLKELKKELFKAQVKRYSSWLYIDEVTKDVNILELSSNRATEQNEYIKRKEHLLKARDYFYDNPEILDKLNNLESSWYSWRLQSNSKSFWIHFHDIITSRWALWKWMDIFIKPVRFEHAKEVINITDLYVKEWWKSIEMLYEVNTNDSKITVNKDKKSKFLEWVYGLVESNPSYSTKEKELIKNRIDEYVNKITSSRISSPDRVLNEFNRIVNWYESKLSMLDRVDTEISKIWQADSINETLSTFEKFKKEIWIDFVTSKKDNFFKNRELEKVKKMIYNNELVLNKADLTKVFENIKNGKPFAEWINITPPTFEDTSVLKTKAEEVWWNIKDTNETIKKDWFIENIKSYVWLDWTIDNKVETERINMLNKYEQMLSEWKINVTPDQARQDLIKISKWYLPYYEALSIIDEEIKKATVDTEKQWLDALKRKILSWRTWWTENWEWTRKDLTDTIDEFKRWVNMVDKNVSFTDDEIKKLVERWKEIKSKSLKNWSDIDSLFEKKTFSQDMNLRQIREMVAGRNYKYPSDEMENLFNKVNTNNYTKWHFLYIATQIAEWVNPPVEIFLSEADQITIEFEYNDRNVKNNDIWRWIVSNVNTEINSIKSEADFEKKVKRFNELKNLVDIIDRSELGDFYKKENYEGIKTSYINLLNEIDVEKERIKENKQDNKGDDSKKRERRFNDDLDTLNERYRDIKAKTGLTDEQRNLEILEACVKSRLEFNDLPSDIQNNSLIQKYYQKIDAAVNSSPKIRREITEELKMKYGYNPVETKKIKDIFTKEADIRQRIRRAAKPK